MTYPHASRARVEHHVASFARTLGLVQRHVRRKRQIFGPLSSAPTAMPVLAIANENVRFYISGYRFRLRFLELFLSGWSSRW